MKHFYILFLLTASILIVNCADNKDPRSAEAHLESAILSLDVNDNDRAISELSMALKKTSSYDLRRRAYGLRLLAYARKGDYNKAAADLYETIKIITFNMPQLSPRSVISNIFEEKVDAREESLITNLSLLILQSPNNAAAYVLRGIMYLKRNNRGDNEKATEDFGKAIQFNPKNIHAHILRSWSLTYEGDHAKAISHLNEAIRLQPKDAGLYALRANLHLNKEYEDDEHWEKERDKVIDNVIADFSEAIRLAPQNYKFYEMRGEIYFEKDDYSKAIADYSEAIQRADTGNISRLYRPRGILYAGESDYDKAIADFALEYPNSDTATIAKLISNGQAFLNANANISVVYFGLALQRDSANAVAQRELRKVIGEALRDKHKNADAMKAFGEKLLGSEIAVAPARRVASTASQSPHITIVNNTGYLVKGAVAFYDDEVYLLSSDFIYSGQSVRVTLPHPIRFVNRCDIALVDSDGDAYLKRNVLVTSGSRIVFTFNDIVDK